MNNIKFSIGVLGGMGTYATIHLFTQFANVFPAIKEWERPRIIIDNRSDMPSRVRAWLSQEDEKVLVNQMVDSIHYLIELGVNYIIIACNTAHLFLPNIYEFLPKSRGLISNIILNCVEEILSKNIAQVTILGTEATVKSRVYHDLLFEGGVNVISPSTKELIDLRRCIEAVKTNTFTKEIDELFVKMVNRYDNVLLGCTELPILYERNKKEIAAKVYDPILITLKKLYLLSL